MHDKNGLWNDLMIDYDNLPDTWDKFDLSLFDSIKNIKDSFGIDILYPAGSSVHFDIDWLRQLAEKTCTLFSHRHLDVSSLKLAQWCSTGVYNKSATDSVHRALPDVMASLNWLREYIRPASDISTLATHLHKMSEDY